LWFEDQGVEYGRRDTPRQLLTKFPAFYRKLADTYDKTPVWKQCGIFIAAQGRCISVRSFVDAGKIALVVDRPMGAGWYAVSITDTRGTTSLPLVVTP
jgi:hypothetical protein